jgi:cyclopropane fatty-acyl-phospholipid synthase-like methyltransferase
MSFYSVFSKNYDKVFPLNNKQIEFMQQQLPDAKIVLDVGCATGNLAIALAQKGLTVDAFDLDENMIDVAQQKSMGADNIKFTVADMLQIEKTYAEKRFDAVVCFGNTLAHIMDNDQIRDFIHSVYNVLQQHGKFLLQILHYDTICKNKPKSLPLIENDAVKFERFYEYSSLNSVDFITKLTDKQNMQTSTNCVSLNPIKKEHVEKMLVDAGFCDIEFYGSFAFDKLDNNSFHLVVSATK